jgi:hypothetical protein
MNKSEIRTSQVDNRDKPPKGLKDGGTINFECNSCKNALLVLRLVKVDGDDSSNVLTRIAVQCGICGGCSDVKQVHGRFYPGAPSDQMIFDISDDDIDGLETDVLFKSRNK